MTTAARRTTGAPPVVRRQLAPRLWQCGCTPLVSRRTSERTSTVVMLHGPECGRPTAHRRPVVVQYRRQPEVRP